MIKQRKVRYILSLIFVFMMIFLFNMSDCSAIFKHSTIVSFKIVNSGIEPTCTLVPPTYVNTSVLVNFSSVSGYTTQYKTDALTDFVDIPLVLGVPQLSITSNISIQMRYIDASGKVSPTGVCSVGNIDKVAPVIDSFTLDTRKVTKDSLTFDVAAHDGGDLSEQSGIQGYSYSEDNGVTWSALTNDTTYTMTGLTPTTDYTLKVRVYDVAGNYTEESCSGTSATDGFVFNPVTGSITSITGFTSGGRIVIPSIIDGVEVKIIGHNAFKDKVISSLSLPDTLTTIESYAFYRINLSQDTLVIPKDVTDIGAYAFQSGAKNITNLIIESDVVTIGQSSFNSGTIDNVVIKGSADIGTTAFKATNVKTVDLGHSTSIGFESFQNNPIVQEELIIPTECTTVMRNAFNSTTKNIGTVSFPGTGPISLDVASFANGTIKNVIFEKAPNMNTDCFSAAKIETLDLGEATVLGVRAFNNNKLVSVFIPNTVTSMASNSFSGNTTLTSVVVDNAVGVISGAPWGITSTTITYLR